MPRILPRLVHRLAGGSRGRCQRMASSPTAGIEGLKIRVRARAGREMRALLELFDARRRKCRIPHGLRTLRRRARRNRTMATAAFGREREILMSAARASGLASALASSRIRGAGRGSGEQVRRREVHVRRFVPRRDSRSAELVHTSNPGVAFGLLGRFRIALASSAADCFFRRCDRASRLASGHRPRWRLAWPVRHGADPRRSAGKCARPLCCATASPTSLIFTSATITGTRLTSPIPLSCIGAGSGGAGTFSRRAASNAGARLSVMHPMLSILSNSAPSRFTPTACSSRRVCCSAFGMRSRHAPRAGLNPEKVWNLGIYVSSGRADRRESLADPQRLGLLRRRIPREIFSIATFQSGGTFYGGVARRRPGDFSVHALPEDAASAGAGHVRRRSAAGPRDRAARLLCRRMLLRQADVASLGRHVHESDRRANCGHSAGRSIFTRRSSTKPPPNS